MVNYFKKILLVLWAVGFLSCSSSTSTTTPTAATIEEDLATFIRWAGHAWDDVAASLNSAKGVELTSGDCGDEDSTAPGSITVDADSITFNDCEETYGSIIYLSRGDYTWAESDTLTTHEWEQTILVDENGDGTYADDEPSFTTTGTISFGIADDLIVFDYSAVFDSGTVRLTGTVSDNSDGTSDVTASVSLDGEAWQDCSFDDEDLDTLTDTEVDEANTDDDDPACATLDCANDLQCQIFADDTDGDEFQTDNTVCTVGCCALVVADEEEEGEEDACPGSSACTTNFGCQTFADNDLTDEFTTANSSCDTASGCCVTTD